MVDSDLLKYSPYFSPFTGVLQENYTFLPLGNFDDFTRMLNPNYDCVINAMLLLGLISAKEAELLRVTTNAQQGGFVPNDIQLLFKICYHFDSNRALDVDFGFTEIEPNNFENIISSNLPSNYGVLCGIQHEGGGHVFIIANNSGRLCVLDPQLPDTDHICYGGGTNGIWDCINRYLGGYTQAKLFILANGNSVRV